MKNFNLTMGKLLAAWKSFPEDRKQIARFPPGKPIFITGAHRSGTTWAAAMLAEPGFWYIHEPFNPNKGIWREPFTYTAPDSTNEQIDRYLEALVQGHHRRTLSYPRTDHPLMPLRVFRQPIQRVLIKDPLACLLTGYVARHFDFDMIVLFRHPAGFASSVTRLGWPVGEFLARFLGDAQLMSHYLFPYAQLLEEYQKRDDIEAAGVFHGVLNTVLWSQSQENKVIRVVRYEDLCQAPLEQFEKMFKDFELPYSEKTRVRHRALCFHDAAPNESSRPHQVNRASLKAFSSWRKVMTPKDVMCLRRIWDQFEIPLYREDSDWSVREMQKEERRC